MSTQPSTPDDFYRAYAIAMLTWQRVESALFRVYFEMFENGNYSQAGVAYYSLDSFGAKLRLVDATASALFGDVELKSWEALSKEIRAGSGDRNVLAHLPAAVVINDDQSLSLVLGPHIHIPPSLVRKRKTTYDAATCQQLADHFESLQKRLDAFRSKRFWTNVGRKD